MLVIYRFFVAIILRAPDMILTDNIRRGFRDLGPMGLRVLRANAMELVGMIDAETDERAAVAERAMRAADEARAAEAEAQERQAATERMEEAANEAQMEMDAEAAYLQAREDENYEIEMRAENDRLEGYQADPSEYRGMDVIEQDFPEFDEDDDGCPPDQDFDSCEDNMTDVEADADTLRSCGWGMDEDYGDFGNEEGW